MKTGLISLVLLCLPVCSWATNVTHSVSPEDARENIVLEDVTEFETVDW